MQRPERIQTEVHVRAAPLVERSFRELVTAPDQWRSVNEIVVATPFPAVVEHELLAPRLPPGTSVVIAGHRDLADSVMVILE